MRVTAALSAIITLSLSSTVWADLQFSITADSLNHYRFTLTNTSSSPLEVITDRRLVWIEQTPPLVTPGVRARRPRALGRCVHPARPLSNDSAARSTIGPGQHYSEDLSLYELCGFRAPAWLNPGAQVTVHYGFGPAPHARPSLSQTLVLDERSAPVNDLTTTSTLSPQSAEGPAPAGAPGPPTLSLSRAQSPSARDIRVTVRLTNTSVHPITLPWRTSMFRFEVRSPTGSQTDCRALSRRFGAQREYFVRVAGHRSLTLNLLPALYCPQETFSSPGVYDITAEFNNTLDGREYGLQRVFTGTLRSGASMLRITHGNGRFLPLRPELGP